jgi:hypothetical protein
MKAKFEDGRHSPSMMLGKSLDIIYQTFIAFAVHKVGVALYGSEPQGWPLTIFIMKSAVIADEWPKL